jgi:hypothetical protein
MTPLRLQPCNERRLQKCLAELQNTVKPALNFLIEFRTMIPVIGKRGMDLAQSQVGMLILDLFGTPAVRLLVQYDFNHFCRRSGNPRDSICLDQDVLIASLSYSHMVPLITVISV